MLQSNYYKRIIDLIERCSLKKKRLYNTTRNIVIPIKYVGFNWGILFRYIGEINIKDNDIWLGCCNCRVVPLEIIIIWNNNWISYSCPKCKFCNVLGICNISYQDMILCTLHIKEEITPMLLVIY